MNETLKNPAHLDGESMNVEPLHEGSPLTECQHGSPTLTASATWHPAPIDTPPNTTIAPAMVFGSNGAEMARLERMIPTHRPVRREASQPIVAQPRDTLNDIKAERGVLGCVLMAPSHAEARRHWTRLASSLTTSATPTQGKCSGCSTPCSPMASNQT